MGCPLRNKILLKINKIKNKNIKITLIFLIILTTLNINIKNIEVIAENGPNIIVEDETTHFQITTGQTISEQITIINNNSKNISFSLSYSSNLELDENTIGLWNFNEGEGTQFFDKKESNNGTINGATWTNGLFGQALKFDGVNDYAIVSNPINMDLDSFTMETWIKIDNTNYWTPIGAIKYEEFGLYYREDGVFKA